MNEYNENYFGGRAWRDLLNRPSDVITAGDWVSGSPYVYESMDDTVELRLD